MATDPIEVHVHPVTGIVTTTHLGEDGETAQTVQDFENFPTVQVSAPVEPEPEPEPEPEVHFIEDETTKPVPEPVHGVALDDMRPEVIVIDDVAPEAEAEASLPTAPNLAPAVPVLGKPTLPPQPVPQVTPQVKEDGKNPK